MTLNIMVYITLFIFLIAITARAIRIARMPVHLRWELYPVPHEKGRAHYGGSMLEEVDWWTKPQHKDHFGDLKVMIPEILFLKAVWEHNRNLWWGTFPLHFGFYLLIGNMALLVLNTILTLIGVEFGLLITVIPIIAWVGCGLGIIGAIIMFFKRMFDPDLSIFSTPSHYFNLIIMGAIFLTGILWLVKDANFASNLAGFYLGLVKPTAMPEIASLNFWHIGFSLFFMFYLPFTHMTHFFTKYFTYHSVRWEDETNRPGDPLQKRIDPQLEQIVSWSAPHVGADGKKNWVDIATGPLPGIKEDKK